MASLTAASVHGTYVLGQTSSTLRNDSPGLGEVYSDAPTIAQAKAELESGDIVRYGMRVLTMANYAGKGWFAIMLGKAITPDVHIPDYILDALFMAHRPVSNEILASIIDYRLKVQLASGLVFTTETDAMRVHLERFRKGEIDFTAVRTGMLTAFPGDRINTILATLQCSCGTPMI